MDRSRYMAIRSQLKVEKPLRFLLAHYAIDAAIISVIYLAFVSSNEILSIIPLATLMFRNFSLMHDATHLAVSNNRRLNDVAGELAGWLCFLPFETWKRSHLEHHLWSGNIEKDPVMALRISLPKTPKSTQNILTFGWRTWIPILALLQYSLFWKLCFQKTKQERNFSSIVRFILPILSWTIVLALSSSAMIWLGFVPALVLYMVAVEVVNFPHHLQLPMTYGNTKYPIWEQYKSSRTCLYPRWFARLFVLNFNYHSEHHMFPDAPWHMLEKIHLLVRNELNEKQNLDYNLDWILENRSKSLSDVVLPVDLKKVA